MILRIKAQQPIRVPEQRIAAADDDRPEHFGVQHVHHTRGDDIQPTGIDWQTNLDPINDNARRTSDEAVWVTQASNMVVPRL
ncbi:hypothetical protein [Paracoccus sp. PAR01]|uniref:hypothetical protein n=1 Tax=Paracoccus sp. PAR01 TaxID=2769282 RepID=UPI0017823ECF|nr:hypothetical protein [Paracoccus sp. PAR01]MBD9529637.1 hypothetical protein [Paracoccus sp. PAR01]